MPNLTGQMLGKVRVDMFLARGGMAEVFIGTHTTLHRAVAIKFLKGDLQDEPELRERFEREARVIAMLRHPNIVQVYDFDTFENQPYLVMEYVPGASLAAYLKELHKNGQRLDINQVISLLDKLANALKYAHDNAVVHRDIKPANILLTSRINPVSAGQPLPEDAEPIITDFGLVRFTQSNKQTSTGMITGTPAYMSPEQARGDRVDERTDVYSLGVTVYEMLAGRVPFDSDSTLSLLHKQIYDPPPPIPGISQDLQAVMDRALAKHPDERFRTPVEFSQAFRAAVTGTAHASTLQIANSFLASITKPRPAIDGSVGKNPFLSRFILPLSLTILLVVVTGVVLILRSGTDSASLTPPQATAAMEQHTLPTDAVATEAGATSAPEAPLDQPVGLLRFQDGAAKADQVSLTASGLPLPPQGSQYEAWLIEDDGEQRVSLGVLTLDSSGRGLLTYVDPLGRNLIGLYHALEITSEPNPDTNPIPSNQVAFSVLLPRGGYTHVRHLLASFSGTPGQVGFVDGLVTQTGLINTAAEDMLAALQAGDQARVRSLAEQMLNIAVGDQSPDYKDWDGNGAVDDPGDGFGLLLNGDNEGYIQGTFTHANLSRNAEDASENMLVHGDHVAVAAQNLSQWTPELRDKLIAILNTAPGADLETLVREAVALANHIQNGVDINGNENIEPIPGEGGALTARQHAYYMADIVIFASNTP